VGREQPSQRFLEHAAALHRGLTRDKEHDILGHETKNRFHVTRSGCAMPPRNEVTYGLLVSIHGDPCMRLKRLSPGPWL
jgi:hypothetical protein